VSGEVVASNDALGDEPGMCADNTHTHSYRRMCVYVHVCMYVLIYILGVYGDLIGTSATRACARAACRARLCVYVKVHIM
jgi:hypothetical protein